MANTWTERWKEVRPLSSGGQGETFVVEDATNGSQGVLKLLRRPKSEQARRRMYQEVTNLKILANAGCAVPRVIDDNTASFQDLDVPLFMVMEYVSGSTLQAVVEERKVLPLETSISIATALLRNLAIAHKERILHRDLKPANILIPRLEPLLLTVVDLGLSFNQDDDDGGGTRPTEVIDNHFLSLPEGRVPGGDKRDPRSDITCIAGVLFYCVTGTVPGVLQDGLSRAPHRRVDLASFVSDPSQLTEIRSLFDRAFNVSVSLRFQSCDELAARLEMVLKPGAERTVIGVEEFAKRTGQLLLAHNRKAQLATYAANAAPLIVKLAKQWQAVKEKIAPFHEAAMQAHDRPDRAPLVVGEALTNVDAFAVCLALSHTDVRGCVEYAVRVLNDECVLMRASCTSKDHQKQRRQPQPPPPPPPTQVTPWTPIYRFRGMETSDAAIAIQDLEASLVRVMEVMEATALAAAT